jgi:hypothetical protein
MKKMLLVMAVSFFTLEAIAQVVVAGVSPASVQGNYDYGWQANEAGWPGETDDGTWALALDFNVDGTNVEGEIMLVEDGTPGTNLQGNPISQEGCSPLTNDLTGKIAVIYRNTCNFSLKAYNAQMAGAIAVIIVNREDAGISMTAGPDGVNVTIPVVILNKTDGSAMIAAMQGGTVPVVMFIGNKFGIYANDIGSGVDNTIIATQATTPSILAQSAADFSFTPGLAIVNYGTATQTNVYVTATIDAPGAPAAYTSTVGPLTMVFKDTINIFDGNPETFALFSLPAYPLGEYTLNYTITLGMTTADEATGDNSFTSNFYVSDDIYSYARLNMVDNEPVSMSFPMNYTQGYKSCIRFNNANASRAGVEGLYTSIKVDLDTFDLQAQEISLYAYTWNDLATTFSATPTFLDFTQVAFAQYYPPASYVNGEEIFIPFAVPFILVDNTNYLFCIETQIPEPAFGYDDIVNYNANSQILDDVISPIYIDDIGTTTDQWYAAGWNGNPAPSIGMKLFPAAELGLVDATELKGIAYPNPASDNVTVAINATGAATLVVTDITGKIVLNKNLSLTNGNADVNTSSLEAGIYIFNVTLDNNQTSQFNVVIK